MMGQMMEPVTFPEYRDINSLPEKPWKIDGAKGRPRRVSNPFCLMLMLKRPTTGSLPDDMSK
jgi:2-oxoglutarate ferredoxin oxidoreductase subunit alpha